MIESKIELGESQRLAFVEKLRGKVFHVTFAKNLPSIKKSRGILVNSECLLNTTFGDSSNSIFRMRGCVSVFDYQSPSTEKWKEYWPKCNPLDPGDDGDLAFLFLSESANQKLIRWKDIKDEWESERVDPHVEAGHKGTIQLSDISKLIIVTVKFNPDSLESKLRRASRNPYLSRSLSVS
jgi:hypothetical protein